MSGPPPIPPADATGGLAKTRIAHNEAVFRDVNERIADGQWPGEGSDRVAFRCECGSLSCNQLIEVTLALYERVRSDSRHFLLVPGHDIPGVEVIVESDEDHIVVEKVGIRGEVADATDPR